MRATRTLTHTKKENAYPRMQESPQSPYRRCYSDVPSSSLVPQCRPPLPTRLISLSLQVDLIALSYVPFNTEYSLASINGRPATADSSPSDNDDCHDTPRGARFTCAGSILVEEHAILSKRSFEHSLDRELSRDHVSPTAYSREHVSKPLLANRPANSR